MDNEQYLARTQYGPRAEYGLVQRTPEDLVFVALKAVEIYLALAKRSA
jgi:hypothetical protein